MSELCDKPLVTFALFAYNQEKYIREAIEGAFAQTYEPLVIVLSDDCSTDRTYEIMCEMAEAYLGGHRIRLNRNAINQGLANHLNIVTNGLNSELVILAAGDDISEPHRTESIVKAWCSNRDLPQLLHSSCSVIDEESNYMSLLVPPDLESLGILTESAMNNSFVIGATEAFSTNIFKILGGFRSDLIHEDRSLVFRTLLLGGNISYLPEPLVRYRQGVGISGQYGSPTKKAAAGPELRNKLLNRFLVDYLQKYDDLKIVENGAVKCIVNKKIEEYKVALEFEYGFPFAKLCEYKDAVGNKYLFKMILKRIKNIIFDRIRLVTNRD